MSSKGHQIGSLYEAREVLTLHGSRSPSPDARLIAEAVAVVSMTRSDDAISEILVDGFFAGSADRYEEHIAPGIVSIEASSFEMGRTTELPVPFCGESPAHAVSVSPYAIGAHAVTNELYGLFDRTRLDLPGRDRKKPAVDVNWYEALIFALWMGCRLPTEAEWELACGGASDAEWCCGQESQLARYAWYSENAGGEVRPVGLLDPNSLGLYDLHGNVWEWCLDTYDADYYRFGASHDPVCVGQGWPEDPRGVRHYVCRGGSVHSLAEMCRTRYRLHEPADFSTDDLGFRVARSRQDQVDANHA